MHLLLTRHAKAEKNLEITYGGDESPLLEASSAPLAALGRELAEGPIRFERVVSSAHLQCRQTAAVLAAALDLAPEVDAALAPATVGAITGRTFAEVCRDDPALGERLLRWRAGELEIQELAIPGMVDPHAYYETSRDALARLIEPGASTVLVASLSILIGIGNVLLGRVPGPGGDYRALPFDNLDRLGFAIDTAGEGTRLAELSTITPF